MSDAEAWLAERVPDAQPLAKHDTATRAWRAPGLFIKLFPHVHYERAAVEAEIAAGQLHPRIVPLLLLAGVDDGTLLLYPWVEGETLGTPEARARFYALPTLRKQVALAGLFDAYAAIGDAGWTLVDVYEGNLLYDARRGAIWCFDWDLSVRGDHFTLQMERNYGSSRLMAPEEFRRGARIDARANGFNLGRMASLALPASGEALRAVLECATYPEPERRYPTIRAFAEAFREQILGP